MTDTLDPKACLGPTALIDSEHPEIRAAAAALDLGTTPNHRAQACFYFVRNEITYDFIPRLDPDAYIASNVLANGRGFCVQKAMLLCALGRAAGVPTALVTSDVRDLAIPPAIAAAMGTTILFHHGLNAFYLDDHWVRTDASLSPEPMAKRKFRLVEFDGRSDALLHPTTLADTPHAEYLHFAGPVADLDFGAMIDRFARGYANADIEALAELGITL